MPALAFSNKTNTTSAGTLTSTSFTPQTGDIIVVKIVTADSTYTYNTPTGGGWTYTSRVVDATASHCWLQIWTAPVTTGGTAQTVAATVLANPTNVQQASMVVELWRNAQLAATPATCDSRGTGAPSTPITTVAANSVVSWCNGDWAAVSPTGHTYNTTSATPTEDGLDDQSGVGAYVGYYAYQTAATAGSQTLGLTAPTGQTWTLAGIEIQDAGGTAPQPPPVQPYIGGQAYRRRRAVQQQRILPAVPPAAITPVTLTDVAAATDNSTNFSVTASVPLADTAAGVEALAITEAGPEGDVAGAVDALTVTVSVPLTDVGAVAEAQAITVQQADVGAAVDSLAVQASVSPADVAAAVDTPAIAAAVPLPDVAGAADALSVTATVPLADTGAAAEALSVTAAAGLADAAGAVDSLVSGSPTTEGDVAAGADALAIAAAVPLHEVAGAADALTVLVAVPLADAAGAADTIVSGSPTTEGDAAAAVEQLTTSVTLPLGDVAAAADQLILSSTLAVPDVAAAVDAFAVQAAPPESDVAAAVDALSVIVTVGLADAAGVVELETVPRQVALAEVAGAADSLFVVTGIFSTGTVYFKAMPEPARWHIETLPGTARWKATPAPARWKAMLQTFDPISAASVEQVNIRWTSDLDGVVTDPTVAPLIVQGGFAVSSGNVAAPNLPSQWYTGSWLIGGTGKGYVSQHPVGAGSTGPTLTAGKYDVWGYIQGNPESPKKFVGVLTVY